MGKKKTKPFPMVVNTKRGCGTVTGITPLGFLAVVIDNRMAFILPQELIDL